MTTTYFWFAPSSPMLMPMATLLRAGSLRWQLEGQPGILHHGELLTAAEITAVRQRMHDALRVLARTILARGARVQALAPRGRDSALASLEGLHRHADVAEAEEVAHLVGELPVAAVRVPDTLFVDPDGASLAVVRACEARPVAAGVLDAPDEVDVEAGEGLRGAVD